MMRNTKTEFKIFAVPAWQEEQDYLRSQHLKGWKFTRVSGIGCYHFEKCEPEDVVYQLDYNPDGLSHKDKYTQMFFDCGWEYLQDYVGYSYFRKPVAKMNGEEEIFCDRASRKDMMTRVFKGRLLPMVTVFFLILLPQFYMLSHASTPANHMLMFFYTAIVFFYIAIFAWFGIQCLRFCMKS